MRNRLRPAPALTLLAWGTALAIATHPGGGARTPASLSDCQAWTIAGANAYGNFRGELQLRGDGSALRRVRYETPLPSRFQLAGLQLEELWLGQREGENSARFDLVSHRFLSVVGDQNFNASDFAHKESVVLTATGEKLESCIPPTDEPIRREEHLIDESGTAPFLVKLVKDLFLGTVIERFQKLPELDPYRNHPEFQNKSHFRVVDFTDRDFYRRNKGVLRVRNQVLSEAAILEAELRRSAYANSIDEKARLFDQKMSDDHLNSVGIFSLRQGKLWIPDGDAALWTGMYAASQFARYQVTGEPQAFENARRALSGILLLLEITGDPTHFARSAMKPDPDVSLPGWKLGAGPYAGIMYLPGGNNDMFHGVAIALVWAYRSLPEGDPLRARVLSAMRGLAPIRLRDEALPNPVYVSGLKALADHDADAYQKYLRAYLGNDHLQNLLDIGRGFYVEGIADWSGVNLSLVGGYTQLLIAHEMTKVFPKTPLDEGVGEGGEPIPSGVTAEWVESQQKQNLLDMDHTYRSPGRDFVCLLAFAANRSRVEEAPSECRTLLEETPSEIPTDLTLGWNSRLRPEFVASPSPIQPWKLVGKPDEPLINHLQGNRIFPLFETYGYSSDMMWKENPLALSSTRAAGLRFPRVDFLFSYWTDRLGEIR